jgi:hypothetical protein
MIANGEIACAGALEIARSSGIGLPVLFDQPVSPSAA